MRQGSYFTQVLKQALGITGRRHRKKKIPSECGISTAGLSAAVSVCSGNLPSVSSLITGQLNVSSQKVTEITQLHRRTTFQADMKLTLTPFYSLKKPHTQKHQSFKIISLNKTVF